MVLHLGMANGEERVKEGSKVRGNAVMVVVVVRLSLLLLIIRESCHVAGRSDCSFDRRKCYTKNTQKYDAQIHTLGVPYDAQLIFWPWPYTLNISTLRFMLARWGKADFSESVNAPDTCSDMIGIQRSSTMKCTEVRVGEDETLPSKLCRSSQKAIRLSHQAETHMREA